MYKIVIWKGISIKYKYYGLYIVRMVITHVETSIQHKVYFVMLGIGYFNKKV